MSTIDIKLTSTVGIKLMSHIDIYLTMQLDVEKERAQLNGMDSGLGEGDQINCCFTPSVLYQIRYCVL